MSDLNDNTLLSGTAR